MDLIASYVNSDSEDDSDPWSRSRVSTKRSVVEEHDVRPIKKVAGSNLPRLPLPSALLQGAHSIVRVDDPKQHNNRLRSFPHEAGNWATFVYFPWKATDAFLNHVDNVCQYISQQVELTKNDEFHITLTRTVILRHHWIEDFVSTIKKALNDVECFPLHLVDLAVYVNENKTRTFIGITVLDTSSKLNIIVTKLNSCLSEYGLAHFYEDPSFHISIAWCVGDRKEELEKLLTDYTTSYLDYPGCYLNELVCKVGHLRFACPLTL